jgi:hypothetical protein
VISCKCQKLLLQLLELNDSSTPNLSPAVSLDAKENERFSNAALNDNGDLLFALSYGAEVDGEKIGSLHCWKFEDGGVREVPDLTCKYPMVGQIPHTN